MSENTVRWFKSGERLPKRGETVLAFWSPKGGAVHVGCFGVATMSTPGHWHDPEDDADDYVTPTHWMPLPPQPEDIT